MSAKDNFLNKIVTTEMSEELVLKNASGKRCHNDEKNITRKRKLVLNNFEGIILSVWVSILQQRADVLLPFSNFLGGHWLPSRGNSIYLFHHKNSTSCKVMSQECCFATGIRNKKAECDYFVSQYPTVSRDFFCVLKQVMNSEIKIHQMYSLESKVLIMSTT